MTAEQTIATLRLAYVRELRKRLAADAEALQKAYQDVGNQLGRKMAAQAEMDTEVTRLEQEVAAEHLERLADSPVDGRWTGVTTEHLIDASATPTPPGSETAEPEQPPEQ